MLLNKSDSDSVSAGAVWTQFICQIVHHLHRVEWIFQDTLLLKTTLAATLPLFLAEACAFFGI